VPNQVVAFVDSFYSLLSAASLSPRILVYPSKLDIHVKSSLSQILSVRPILFSLPDILFLFALLPFRTYISACRFRHLSSPFVRFLPDGQLTQILIEKSILPHSRFLASTTTLNLLASLRSTFHVNPGLKIIIGSNWVESGCMTHSSYVQYLRSLSNLFPNYQYKPHPSEDSSYVAKYFSLIETDLPLELYVIENGIPFHTVTSGSTAPAFLARLISSFNLVNQTHFHCITNIRDYCDGSRGIVTGSYSRNGVTSIVTTDCLLKATIADLHTNGVGYTLVRI
jgi:hypothetical protein